MVARLADLLRQMQQRGEAPAAVQPSAGVPREVEVPEPARVEESKEKGDERHTIHVELTSHQLERLIEAAVSEVMNAEQLARYLQKGKDWVRRMARTGHIPAAKVGNSWRFIRKEVDMWLLGLGRASTSGRGESGRDSNK